MEEASNESSDILGPALGNRCSEKSLTSDLNPLCGAEPDSAVATGPRRCIFGYRVGFASPMAEPARRL